MKTNDKNETKKDEDNTWILICCISFITAFLSALLTDSFGSAILVFLLVGISSFFLMIILDDISQSLHKIHEELKKQNEK